MRTRIYLLVSSVLLRVLVRDWNGDLVYARVTRSGWGRGLRKGEGRVGQVSENEDALSASILL